MWALAWSHVLVLRWRSYRRNTSSFRAKFYIHIYEYFDGEFLNAKYRN